MITETEWIRFVKLETDTKTDLWNVDTKKSGENLGYIKWHNPWRNYCFFPTHQFDTVLSDRCLLDIGEFILELNKKYKNEAKS